MADSPTSPDYQSVFHSLPSSFLLLASDGTVLDNSDEHVAVSMLPREQAQGRSIFDAYPSSPESQRELAASQEAVRRTQQPDSMPLLRYDLERPAALGGGTEERYWQLTHYPLLDEAGQLQFILQTPQDVTEQYQAAQAAARAQQALTDSNQRTEFILESLPVLVWTSRPDGTPDYFNPRWLEFTGRTMDDMLALDWNNLTHPDDQAGLVQGWAEAIAAGAVFQFEYRMRRHDGEYRWLLIRAVPRRDADGQITMWLGAANDIHEQRQLVQTLLEANEEQATLADEAYQTYQQTESQREAYHNLFMQAPALICILRGSEYRYDFVNPSYQELFQGRQLQGLPLVEALPELKDQGIIDLLDGVYQTGQTFYGNELLVKLQQRGGELREGYYNFTYQQFRENGQPAGILVFAFEVTELVRARQVLEQLRATGPAGAPAQA